MQGKNKLFGASFEQSKRIVKKEILGKTGRDIPSYLDYQVHISKDAMFNTPPVFPIYAISNLQVRIIHQ